MSQLSPQTLFTLFAALALVLWYKGYFDSFLNHLGANGLPSSAGDDLFLRAVKKAVADAELSAHQATADRFRTQIQSAVQANFVAAGPNTQAPSTPANPAPSP